MKLHRNQGDIKYEIKYNVFIEVLQGLASSQSMYFIQWKTSKVKGESKRILLSADGSAMFNYEFETTVTMHKSKKDEKFESRSVKISVQEETVKGKKVAVKTIGTLVLELADYANHTGAALPKQFPLSGTKNKTSPATLKVGARATWLKIDGKVVTESRRSDGSQREAVDVDGQKVYLMTDQAASDEEDNPDEEDPFKEENPYEGNALFRKMGGDYEAPNDTKVESTYAGNALFKKTGVDFEEGPENKQSSVSRLLEEAKFVSAKSEEPPVAKVSSERKVQIKRTEEVEEEEEEVQEEKFMIREEQSPQTPSHSHSAQSPPMTPLSPSSEELGLLRSQNKLLKATLESQESKIEMLRKKIEASEQKSKTGGAQEKVLHELSEKLVLTEKLYESQKVDANSVRKELDKEKQKSQSLEAALTMEKKRIDEVGAKVMAVSAFAEKNITEEKKRAADAQERVKVLESLLAAEKKQNENLMSDASSKSSRSTNSNDASNGKIKALEAALATEKTINEEFSHKLKNLETAARKQAEDLSAKSKQLEAEKQKSISLEAAVLNEKRARKKEASSKNLETATKEDSNELAALKEQVASLNRQLSGNQLTIIDLTNRLKDAEAKQEARERGMKGSGATTPLEDELTSTQMQLVAMEQDYESQLEELKFELSEAQNNVLEAKKMIEERDAQLSKITKKAEHYEKKSLKLQRKLEEAETQAGAASAELTATQNSYKNTSSSLLEQKLVEKDKLIESMKKDHAAKMKHWEMKLETAEMGAKNPLIERPTTSVELLKAKVGLKILSSVSECIWNAQMKYDKDGVALATASILQTISDDPEDKSASQLQEAVINAITTASTNQLSMSGRLYWLNTVVNLLQILSKRNAGTKSVRGPKEVGILVPGSTGSKIVRTDSMFGTFPQQLSSLSFVIYRSLLLDLRNQISDDVVKAVLDHAMNAREALGARHNVGKAPSADMIVAELDAALEAFFDARLFPSIIKQFFGQVFYDIGALLFNAMLKRDDLSASRCIQIKLEVSNFDNWPGGDASNDVKDLLRGVGQWLNPLKEVCNLFFVDKSAFLSGSYKETCPSLNARQVKSFLSLFIADDICPERVPQNILDRLQEQVKKTDALKLDENYFLKSQ